MFEEKRSREFLDIFKEIEQHLQSESEVSGHQSFHNLIDEFREKHSVIEYYYDQLRHIRNVRNLLVHNHEFYAVPNEKSLEVLRKIKDVIKNPPSVIPLFKKEVLTASADGFLIEATRKMRENNFSQVPVIDSNDHIIDLLTSNSIARWLGSLNDNDSIEVSAGNVRVKDVLEYREGHCRYEIVDRRTSVVEVLNLFKEANKRGERLEAIIITDEGNKGGAQEGIITGSDVTSIYDNIDVSLST
ncbi:CBS domain-containing protein [Halarsenatibacter silvermanii]|uniref:CBS domain-containing protein n=1 Tax=Halarsenatibacter silvermanii TaxID=321763 RepID=A0A1G9SPR3_9FIRM|nr:CBS domain-containing protein [Halarsenatibacter silvermanii]SDM37449.1 CBS domain-containing protein [Halarsenatibacter silvermanii]